MKRGVIIYIAALLLMIHTTTRAESYGVIEEDKAVKVMETDSGRVVIPFYKEILREGQMLFQSRRMDRGVNRGKYIFKGEYIGGISASYLTIDGDNTEIFLLIDDIDGSGSLVSVQPYAAYFYRDNRAVGLRIGYSSINATLDSATFDLGEANDVSFDIPYIMYDSYTYSYSVFHRSYTALDRKGNIALFADIEMGYSHGKSTFEYEDGGAIKHSRSHTNGFDISFNPGISAFMFDNISANLSFEFGGLSYTSIRQYDAEGNYVGKRDASQMRFMFNVFAIKFGMNFHIW